MTLTVTHAAVATEPDDPSAEVKSSDWNDPHVVTGSVSAAIEVTDGITDVTATKLSLPSGSLSDGGSGEAVIAYAQHGSGSPQGTNAAKLATGGPALSGGTWTLTYLGQTTPDIAWDSGTSDVQTALETLTSLLDPTSTVFVTGGSLAAGDDNPLLITFRFLLGSQPIADTDFTLDPSGLTGDTAVLTDETVGALPLSGTNGAIYVDDDSGSIYQLVAGNWWQIYPVLAPFGVTEIDDGLPVVITGGSGAGAGGVQISGGLSITDHSLGAVVLTGATNVALDGAGLPVQLIGGTGGDGTGPGATVVVQGGQPDGIPGAIILTTAIITLPSLPTSDPAAPGTLWNNLGVLMVSAG